MKRELLHSLVLHTNGFPFLLITLISFSCNTCDLPTIPNENTEKKSLIAVVSGGKNLVTFIDYSSFNINDTISYNFHEGVYITGICLSTKKDYFVFSGSDGSPLFKNYIITYDIKGDSVWDVFSSGFDSVGAPRLVAADLQNEPGLVYLYSHTIGLYSIDVMKKEIKLINEEHGIDIHKDFTVSKSKNWIVIKKYVPNYTELEFYIIDNKLNYPDFVLNQNDKDSIDVEDIVFSENDKKIFFSFLLSQRRAIYQSVFFTSYDLELKQMDSSRVTLPWSSAPYYLTYSNKRKEIYLVGEQDKLYIIDVAQKDYNIKHIVNLQGKLPGASSLLLIPDENTLFISCYYNNSIYIVNLENRSIERIINLELPSIMFLIN